jgi:endonuclease/exonuclease/phosphatase family metal-dependent hydrolase
MERIADEIAQRRPDLIGLQEVTKLLVQSPGDFLRGNPQQASAVQFDYLQLLLDALEKRGVSYRVAASIDNADVELPAINPQVGLFYDVRMIDRDVILVREGVRYWNAEAANYTEFLPTAIGGVQLALYRGWTSVDARVHGRDVRFFNTHLETQDAAAINEAQAVELLEIAAQSALPVILAGDFNSAANESAPANRRTQAYAAIRAAGYSDSWTVASPFDEGLTCCHPQTLLGTQTFDQRIDLVFYGSGFFGTGDIARLGIDASATTPSGRWPSDHGGLVAQVWLKDANFAIGDPPSHHP